MIQQQYLAPTLTGDSGAHHAGSASAQYQNIK
jgi:hypothetical protein